MLGKFRELLTGGRRRIKCIGGDLRMALETTSFDVTREMWTVGLSGLFEGDYRCDFSGAFFSEMQIRSNSILSCSVSLLPADHPWEIT